VSFYGIRESVWIHSVLALVEVSGLIIIIILGLLMGLIFKIDYFEFPTSVDTSYTSVFSTIFASTTLIFFAYYGFENSSNISEETNNPTKVIPRALIVSILITTMIYLQIYCFNAYHNVNKALVCNEFWTWNRQTYIHFE
jgi:APA family basic amino acid/polyamine antiporter